MSNSILVLHYVCTQCIWHHSMRMVVFTCSSFLKLNLTWIDQWSLKICVDLIEPHEILVICQYFSLTDTNYEGEQLEIHFFPSVHQLLRLEINDFSPWREKWSMTWDLRASAHKSRKILTGSHIGPTQVRTMERHLWRVINLEQRPPGDYTNTSTMDRNVRERR